jgi:TRAP-type C4-dicarboxylate transport system substrate-binding protein
MSINRRKWDRLPAELRKVLSDLGKEYSEIHGNMLVGLAAKFEGLMQEKGATINQMSQDARVEWANALPDIAGEWRTFNKNKGVPAKEIMSEFLKRMKAIGANPVRNWDA